MVHQSAQCWARPRVCHPRFTTAPFQAFFEACSKLAYKLKTDCTTYAVMYGLGRDGQNCDLVSNTAPTHALGINCRKTTKMYHVTQNIESLVFCRTRTATVIEQGRRQSDYWCKLLLPGLSSCCKRNVTMQRYLSSIQLQLNIFRKHPLAHSL